MPHFLLDKLSNILGKSIKFEDFNNIFFIESPKLKKKLYLSCDEVFWTSTEIRMVDVNSPNSKP